MSIERELWLHASYKMVCDECFDPLNGGWRVEMEFTHQCEVMPDGQHYRFRCPDCGATELFPVDHHIGERVWLKSLSAINLAKLPERFRAAIKEGQSAIHEQRIRVGRVRRKP